jgi:(2Fe-2S) ferredoxin
MKRFEKHIFICENIRPDDHPRGCCSGKGSVNLRQEFKSKLKKLNLSSSVRANAAGCLDACEYGPSVVIYPEQVWYGNVTIDDVDEIISEHIIKNKYVDRLKIKDKRFNKNAE